jgi:release factor glutamine methyltransferase
MQAVIQYIEKELRGLYPKTEIQGFVRLIAEHVCGMNYTQFLLRKNEKTGEAEKEKIQTIVERLKNFEPIQYVFGETEFYGLRLKVNESVLIPRPETEELVQWIVDSEITKSPEILDIGTGSGCIALALKNIIPNANVKAIDVSGEALHTAAENAIQNNLEIDFENADIFRWTPARGKKFNIIVSNPPYVREMEKTKMQPNVLNYEPATALFVSDSDPLVFYRTIASFTTLYLKTDGFLFLEINEALANEMTDLLKNMKFKNIEIRKDLNGKNRMLRCKK